MRRAERLLQLLQILRRHRAPVTGDVIASELEVSLRTVYRDIASLIGDRVPIRGEAGIGYVLEDGFDMPPLMFTVDELEAAMLGLRWVARRGDGQLTRAAKDAVAKIGAVIPEALKPFLFDASLIVLPREGMASDAVDVAALRGAIRDGRKASIRYHNEANEVTRRVIWPWEWLIRGHPQRHRLVRIAPGFPLLPHRPHRGDRLSRPALSRPAKALLKAWQEQMRIESSRRIWMCFHSYDLPFSPAGRGRVRDASTWVRRTALTFPLLRNGPLPLPIGERNRRNSSRNRLHRHEERRLLLAGVGEDHPVAFDAGTAGRHEGERHRIELVFGFEHADGKRVGRVAASTGTAAWAMIGPRSTSWRTKCTVQP